ncbi:helix-turn-helix domain-containing protein [Variovorax sp. J22P168]|uniref:TetR/AcrR family transcriptional regulator n=1 Tax=Variovorax jilinensis TaxID=3053513 RepID=UPI002575740A|nr:TetR/AcrR family transcriptional regulator [Variovorax sp. J22P168]MDM0014925.1 helix-turn-helix domain-containing protein [Variovorax sp. J22P168]
MNKKQLSRERSVETILRTALSVMVKKGYRNTTIEHIADSSGLTKGAVYHYFNSKEDLLMAVLEMVEGDVVTGEVVDPGDRVMAADRLVQFIHSQGERAFERADSFLFLVTVAGDFSNIGEAVGAKVEAIFDRLGRVLRGIVLEGQAAGQFSQRVSPDDLTRLYVSSFSGNVLQWHRSGRRADIGRSQVRALRLALLSVLHPDRVPTSSRPR